MSEVKTSRFYHEISLGQIHCYLARPVDKLKEKKRPLLLLHHSPNSAQVYHTLQPKLAFDRMVLAPDTPGFGMSDKPNSPPSIEQYAHWIIEMLDGLGINECDVIGYHTGAMIATEMSLLITDRIKKVVIIGIPIFNDAEKEGFLSNPWPKPLKPDDTEYINDLWSSALKWRGAGQTLQMLKGTMIAKLQAGDTAWWGARAAFSYPMLDKLAKITQPVKAINSKDDLWEISPRAQSVLKDKIVDFPNYGFGILEIAPERLRVEIRTFLA